MGVDTDVAGRIFVSEQETDQNDGRVFRITPEDQIHPVIIGVLEHALFGPKGCRSDISH